ncbi:hypothetical protein [Candidatus Coxiella mudrowiae]|uniref:hypothetical protein n=1 Tax=Candidatus Coxiella mudrowiae TaxID=2054173 RepID=UPI000C281DC6|nr:hypothetical protein [Candidatus Coxiella mudrowiae]
MQYAVLGWIRIPIINQTIGSPLSKRLNFRGDKFYDLFVLWWNTIPQQWLPVVGGRGKSKVDSKAHCLLISDASIFDDGNTGSSRNTGAVACPA